MNPLLLQHDREKLIQAIVYFAQNTRFCAKTKLFKLLYFLDFEHFKATGRSVTGLTYHAWKMGPVPVSLYEEIESPEPDMAEAIEFVERPTKLGRPMLSVEPREAFDPQHFTRRELALMKSLADEYCNARAEDMIEETHLENQPWDLVFNKQKNRQAPIPYEHALRSDEREMMLRLVKEREQLVKSLG